ncbi:baseplate J/gp47 family protein [Paenibacillus ehimensis]|uniref:Baseplate J/gp47 family protein n=1 Tax=Paenibacillus ehimensis TaxID=79264 RepID=A0ABT8VI32_9BACL|nr:baseplate J/gp47 family protein [Paenibacillus ehimensis]MDO3680644.1 baseplate J/gp47 family protein [Paenibacillus ehimensis]
MIQFPSKDEITQKLVENLLGPGKTLSDLPNQWAVKHLLVGLREAVYGFVVVLKLVYEQFTVKGATGKKLDEVGYEYGVDRKQATKAVHQVTLRKSSPVTVDTPVPDLFLVTTTPYGNNPPVQFRVIPKQEAKILSGQSSVIVKVECTESGSFGTVPNGAINLVAQAGFDSVTDSVLVTAGTEKEDDESYRSRILERKRNPGRGGTASDYKIWAESVEGVVSALVLPRNRGNGTVDIVITGANGVPGAELVQTCQNYIDTKTPADIADGGVKVIAPTSVSINVSFSNCIWAPGYTVATGTPIVKDAISTYISKQANKDRVVRVVDIITTAKNAFDKTDLSQKPVLVDFSVTAPSTNRALGNVEMAVPGTISIS